MAEKNEDNKIGLDAFQETMKNIGLHATSAGLANAFYVMNNILKIFCLHSLFWTENLLYFTDKFQSLFFSFLFCRDRVRFGFFSSPQKWWCYFWEKVRRISGISLMFLFVRFHLARSVCIFFFELEMLKKSLSAEEVFFSPAIFTSNLQIFNFSIYR